MDVPSIAGIPFHNFGTGGEEQNYQQESIGRLKLPQRIKRRDENNMVRASDRTGKGNLGRENKRRI